MKMKQRWMAELHMVVNDRNEFFAEPNNSFEYWKKIFSVCVHMCVCMHVCAGHMAVVVFPGGKRTQMLIYRTWIVLAYILLAKASHVVDLSTRVGGH